MSKAEVAILVPVLDRPKNVKPLLRSIQRATAEPYRVLFIADPDDTEELRALGAAGADYIAPGGSYAHKINAGYEATTEPLLFMAADDLKFWPEWFKRAKGHLKGSVQVVGSNDICNPRVMTGQHSTHTLFRRAYIEKQSGVIDESGKVLHEGYHHDACDDEFIQTAMARKVYAHGWDVIVEHQHWINGKAEKDETYRKGRGHALQGKRLLQRRGRLWRNLSR